MSTADYKFVTEYNVCPSCSDTIHQVAAMYANDMLGDTDDPEAPLMFASDKHMLCGGTSCRALSDGTKPSPGDLVNTDEGVAEIIRWINGLGEYELKLVDFPNNPVYLSARDISNNAN